MMLDYYNGAHVLMLLLVPLVFCAVFFSLKGRNDKTRDRIFLWIMFGNAALFVIYKINMWLTYDTFEILNELPLQLCNLNVILLPIAIKTRNKFLCSYLYYVGTIAALAGVLFFDTTFLDRSVFSLAVFIYFFYHTVLLCSAVLIAALKIYTPRFRDILSAMATLTVLMLTMHIVNTIFRTTGICVVANYFYTYGLPGNPIMDALYAMIPMPMLYLLPLALVLAVVDTMLYLPFHYFALRSRQHIKT